MPKKLSAKGEIPVPSETKKEKLTRNPIKEGKQHPEVNDSSTFKGNGDNLDTSSFKNLKENATVNPVKEEKLYPVLEGKKSSVSNRKTKKLDSSSYKNDLYPHIDESFDKSSESSKIPPKRILKKNGQDRFLTKRNICLIVIVFLISLFGYFFLFFGRVEIHSTGMNVSAVIVDLKKEFKNQPPLSFKIIQKAVEKVITTPEPQAPAIVILLAAQNAEKVTETFSKKLVQYLSVSSECVTISAEEFKDEEPAKVKKNIDEKFKSELNTTDLKVVLVENLDKIPFDAAMIFHSYCDHENAPFKYVIYIMTVSSGVRISSDTRPKVWDGVVTDHLNKMWPASIDDRSSLLSRLTVYVAAILPPKQ